MSEAESESDSLKLDDDEDSSEPEEVDPQLKALTTSGNKGKLAKVLQKEVRVWQHNGG